MNKLYGFLSILLAVIALWLIANNTGTSFEISILTEKLAKVFSTNAIGTTLNTAIALSSAFLLGLLTTLFALLPTLKKGKEKEGAYERKLEKTAVSNDASTARVKVLEAKIQTLEKALEQALKNK